MMVCSSFGIWRTGLRNKPSPSRSMGLSHRQHGFQSLKGHPMRCSHLAQQTGIFLYMHIARFVVTIQPVGCLLMIRQNCYDFAFSTVAHNGVVKDIAFDTFHKCLATVGNGCMKLWEIDEKCKSPLSPPIVSPAYLCPVVACNSVTTPPKSSVSCCVTFLDEGHDILISYLDSHEVYVP